LIEKKRSIIEETNNDTRKDDCNARREDNEGEKLTRKT